MYSHSTDYTTEALGIAKEEFLGRKLDASALSDLGTAAEELRTKEEARLGWTLRIVAFFFGTVFFGITMLVGYRHFAEQGARRKAREWVQWGLFGLAFYLALFVVTMSRS